MKKRNTPVNNMEAEWNMDYKPRILSCRSVPLSLVAEILDCTVEKVQEMLRSNEYHFGNAKEGKYSYSYDVYPLRFIAWYEGKMQ